MACKILGDQFHNVFTNSSNSMAIYDTVEDRVIDVNLVMRSHTGLEPDVGNTVVVYSSEREKYVTHDGIPCRLTVVHRASDEMVLVEVWAAHTKKGGQSSNLLRLTDMASDGVFEIYPLVNFEYKSERFWNILGYTQDDFTERPGEWKDLMNPEDLERTDRALQQHIDSKGEIPFNSRVRYNHRDGRELIILCRASVIEWLPDGRPWYILGTHTDITEIVKKDSVEAKNMFVARMSHEIRSPLCTILNECELLGDGTRARVIWNTCKQLITLADDILNIHKITQGSVELMTAEENLPSVISKLTKRHRLEAKTRGLKIRTTVDEVPETVLMDLCKFNQVMDNLVWNSLKYSERGKIVLDIEYDYETDTCSIRVTDNGIGMEPGFHASAFEELVQGDNTMLGAGMGLAMSRKFARIMGGDVTIEESSPEKGTTMLFVSRMPQCEDEPVAIEPCVETLEPCRVMIVDDMKGNRDILKRRLENMISFGFHFSDIVEAVNGQAAVSEFSAHNGNFQLVLMDCHMPIMNGYDATVLIHDKCAALGIEAVPVVAVTASISPEIHNNCVAKGMKFVVTKPYSQEDLLASIRACLNKSCLKKI